ncbi:hypothetical protein [Sphingomonas sp.]|uniref:hypothetical protein n=1 Tax=Sphingomonas sp. TaxID=28214 RepID=UPI0035BBA1D0
MIAFEDLSTDEISLLSEHDDDFYGLWEVDWHFNSRRPEWPHEDRVAFVSTMVKRGLFDVFFGPLQTARPPLELNVAFPTAWAPPLDEQEVGHYVTISSVGIAARRLGS